MEENIYLYYTNDLHSNFEQWPQVANFLKSAQSSSERRGNDYWTIDIGDHMDRVNPITEASMGKANVALMNEAGYDFATIGNNEGITMAHDDLFHLYDHADFQVICSNLHSEDQRDPEWLKRTATVESAGGVKIGFVALTAPFNAYYELLGWHISSQFKTLEKYLTELKNTVDIIVLLSHLGLNEDQAIARRFSEIDVIIGGHTHHLLRTGDYVNQTLITAAGKHCYYVGEVILTWNHDAKELVYKEAYATDVSNGAKDLHTTQRLHQLEKEADEVLEKKVVHLDKPIPVKWFAHTEIMQALTNKLKTWTEADCAMLNAGLLLDRFPAGDVTYKDIHHICPHPINPVVIALKGNELIEAVRASFTKNFMELKLKGFGFRGEVLGRMIFSGLNVKTAFREDGGEYVTEVTMNGIELDPNRNYMVATADTFSFGRILPEVAKSEVKNYFLPEFIRDLLADTLREMFP